jgi:hypothetical protein
MKATISEESFVGPGTNRRAMKIKLQAGIALVQHPGTTRIKQRSPTSGHYLRQPLDADIDV